MEVLIYLVDTTEAEANLNLAYGRSGVFRQVWCN